MLEIKIIHNKECGFWREVAAAVRDILKNKSIAARVEEVLIANDEQAKEFKFFGSPQIVINGEDIDPQAASVTNFHASGCRPYFYQGQFYDYPPREMIEEALRSAAG